jgi:hypothetical protein
MEDTKTPTPHELRLISAAACVNEKTTRRYFRDQARSTSSTQARIQEAVVRLGMDHLLGRDLDGSADR